MSIYFATQIDEKNNRLILNLKEPHKLIFSDENPAWQSLQEILLTLSEGQSVVLDCKQDGCDFSHFDNLIQYLSQHKLVCHLRFAAEKEGDTARNKLLDNLYRYALRKRLLNPENIKAINEVFQAPLTPSGKVRHAKQLLNRGIRLHTQSQHHYQHHKEQSVQQEQQKERQAEKQQRQNRQNQIQQQTERMKAMEKQAQEVNVGSLGKLIHAGNLHEMVSDTLSLETLKTLWTNLVGAHAARVENPENRITHVPEDTLRLIIQHKEQFSYGVPLDDLAPGFGFTVHKNEKDELLSILYFDKKLGAGKEKKSFLAARLEEEKPVCQELGDVGQFYSFFDKQSGKIQENYARFIQDYTPAFNLVFQPKKGAKLEARRAALVQLIGLDNPEVSQESLQEQFKDFTEANLDGLATILLEKGSYGVLHLLNKLKQLKGADNTSPLNAISWTYRWTDARFWKPTEVRKTN